MNKENITIHDVARKARVSVATISRVLNNSELVADKTRKRILRIAKELNYVPNASARGLSTRRNDTIGLLLPDVYTEFFSEVIRGADQAAQELGFHFFVSSDHNQKSEMEAALHAIRGRVDGLIIMSPYIDAQMLRETMLPRNLPVVLLNCALANGYYDSLTIDNAGGAFRVVQHLIEHGYDRIAIIKGTDQNVDARERLQGYREALGKSGREISSNLEFAGDFTEASGHDAAQKLLSTTPLPRAIFVSNDAMAVGVLSALSSAGIKVPDEIAIAGFDDIPIARYLTPPLTSVHVSINDLGMLAMKRIIQIVREKKMHRVERTVLPTTIVIRESCGCHK
jgi:LacI family transcriptional regulator